MNASAFPLAARREGTSIVELGGVELGGTELVLIAGPCSVESEDQFREAALAARAAGARVLRGGAFKPRTSPYAFQGLGEEGLAIMRAISDETGLPIVTEALEPAQVPLVARYADAIQIGSRNMHVTPLLRVAGASGCPVLLKRGMSATLEEFLLAAETILLAGGRSVILCERGIRTFDSYTRNCLDVGGIAALKRLTSLPVVADPSHATGRRELVTDAALAAVAAGADGVIVEAHPEPESAQSDADQQLSPSELVDLALRVSRVAQAVGRTFRARGETTAADPFIDALREQISENDQRIVAALNTRLELVAAMRRYKETNGIAFRDGSREERLLRQLEEANPGPLSPDGLGEFVAVLLDLTRKEVAGPEAA